MVLEPLRVAAQRVDAPGGLFVREVDDRFIASLVAQRIPVDLDEAVDEIDVGCSLLDPANAVVVEGGKVAGPIIIDEIRNDLSLWVLRHVAGFFEPADDLLDGRRIHASDLPHPLHDMAVFAGQLGVEAERDWLRPRALQEFCVELIRLFFGEVRAVEVRGRVAHLVNAVFEIDTLGVHRWVEKDGVQFAQELIHGLAGPQGKTRFIGCPDELLEILRGESRVDFDG